MTSTGSIWAILPVKRFDGAKQRLASAFPPAFRQALAAIMVEDVLATLTRARGLSGVVVVTVDPVVEGLARRYGARIHGGDATSGHTAAVMGAARLLASEGADGVLALPGDIPGITADEIDALIDAHAPAPCFTISPSHDRRGSNAIVMSKPDLMPLAYGDDSFEPHLAAVSKLGLTPRVVTLEGVGLDVDHPDDLFRLASRPWRTRTHSLLKDSPVFQSALRQSEGARA